MKSYKKINLVLVFMMLMASAQLHAQGQDRAALQQALIAQKAAVEANPEAFSNQTRDVQFQDNAMPLDICYTPHDPASWTQLTTFAYSETGISNLDDGSSALVNLPFQFDFYGELLSSLYININGNVSFNEPYWEYSSTGFPINDFKMVAPFWADVDLRGAGEIWYKINANSIYINWVGVGYYNSNSDLLNTFQLVLSDGTDPYIGLGNNVAFHYGDMNWTTGSASGGMSIALASMSETYIAAASNLGIPMEVLHRVASMASGGMDTLPHNGAVITLLAITGLSHRQSYIDIFSMTIIKTLAVFLIIAVYYLTGLV
jgi:hypothetical protein